MVSANKIEILRIAETVAQEKMIEKEIVLSALEEALVKAAKSNYGEENEVVAEINHENGDILISRKMLVVEGTVYPLLTRLKNANLLNYRWEESSSGPPRKYYSITPKGDAFLSELQQVWSELNKAVKTITQSKNNSK